MADFTIRIAGQNVGVSPLHSEILRFFAGYLTEGAADFSVAVTAADLAFEREKSRREDILEGRAPVAYSDGYLETIAIQRKIAEELLTRDTLLFHGSVIAVDNRAYLFTAKSGTGKSTHTRLWREYLGDRAVMVNDDKPFLGIRADGVTAYGTPWNGKHRLGTNVAVPLKAICILERGSRNEIRRISPREAVFMLLQQSGRPMDPGKMGKYMDLLDRLSGQVAFWRLQCTMEPEAAAVSYAAMSAE